MLFKHLFFSFSQSIILIQINLRIGIFIYEFLITLFESFKRFFAYNLPYIPHIFSQTIPIIQKYRSLYTLILRSALFVYHFFSSPIWNKNKKIMYEIILINGLMYMGKYFLLLILSNEEVKKGFWKKF